jgi:hypothetical protein
MTRNGCTLAMAIALISFGLASAHAKDLCVSTATFGAGGVVGKNFKVPGKNKCKPFHGFTLGGTYFVHGSGCTSASGDVFHLAITAAAASNAFASPYTFSCTLPLPTLSGGTCASTWAFADSPGDELSEADEPGSAAVCSVDVP